MSLFDSPVHPDDIGTLVDLSVEGATDTQSMAQGQREGVAALYNILCDQNFAYLADEVGMGKTYQALTLAALVWNEKPAARLLFICPREGLQIKWMDDYRRFFASNYRRPQRLGDDRVASVLFSEPVHEPVKQDNLRSWATMIDQPVPAAPFLRHTSFTRPVFVTRQKAGNLNRLWRDTESTMRSCGLVEIQRPAGLSVDTASRQLNLAFARALNAKLKSASGGKPYFDLVVVDEAQALRNLDNQTNRVLFETLQGQVSRWLFMSATPAHHGPADIPKIINHYPCAGEVLDPALAEGDDLSPMQEALEQFMVRRQRRYLAGPDRRKVGKEVYRHHSLDRWTIKTMSTLGTLAMGLVQKGLVNVLAGRNNRYRIGFLSSFESLQSSLSRARDRDGDFYGEDRGSIEQGDRDAPDAEFVDRLGADFAERFGRPLPHPKLESVVALVAPLAFGTDSMPGGEKFLIFTRRLSTVNALRGRLTHAYIHSISERVKRCWCGELDLSGSSVEVEDVPDGYEASVYSQGEEDYDDNPLRRAMSDGWLYRYRSTFSASGRNALFFEDGWLLRLCCAGGVTPEQAAAELPDEIWAESYAHALQSGSRRRVRRLRYLAMQGVVRCPEAFGLDQESAKPWREAYAAALHHHLEPCSAEGAATHRDDALFSYDTLWTRWDERCNRDGLALPGVGRTVDADALCQRQVARTVLGQTFRLTDTLIDLFYANEAAQKGGGDFASVFLDWLLGDDPSAERVRIDCANWLAHLRLVVDSSLGGAGKSWLDLARQEDWNELHNPQPVVGVTGGSGGGKIATAQFRTPSLPRVIVCTDTLKEGVDLHLFCDRVLHYGVAWTPGDLEQRTGRVDRYFSQIERRLAKGGAPAAQLEVGYPHIEASLERGQVQRVKERQMRAEALMDSPIAGAIKASQDLVHGQTTQAGSEPTPLEPFRPHGFPITRRDLVAVSAKQAQEVEAHYKEWYRDLFLKALEARGWTVPNGAEQPVLQADLCRRQGAKSGDRQHQISWSFDGALGRYVLTLSNPIIGDDPRFSSGRRLPTRSPDSRETFIRLLVPNPDERDDTLAVDHFIDILAGQTPQARPDAQDYWGGAVASVADMSPRRGRQGRALPANVEWLASNQARVVIRRGERSHEVMLTAYVRSVQIVGVVAPVAELGARVLWDGAADADRVRDWAHQENNDLPLGFLDVNPQGELVFGFHLLHGEISEDIRRRLVQEVAWRADMWEASLTGVDDR